MKAIWGRTTSHMDDHGLGIQLGECCGGERYSSESKQSRQTAEMNKAEAADTARIARAAAAAPVQTWGRVLLEG